MKETMALFMLASSGKPVRVNLDQVELVQEKADGVVVVTLCSGRKLEVIANDLLHVHAPPKSEAAPESNTGGPIAPPFPPVGGFTSPEGGPSAT